MDIRQYLRVARSHWWLILISVAVCVGAAGAYASLREPVYESDVQFYVSARTSGTPSQSETYQGGLYTESRVQSYARTASSFELAEKVSEELGLSDPSDVQGAITATVPEASVLVDVTVEGETPEQAKEIADGVAEEFPRFVHSLESSGGAASPVKISVAVPPELPTDPASPSTAVLLTLGSVLGLFLGAGGAVLRESFDKRIRYDDEAEKIVDAPILGRILHDPDADSRPVVVVQEPNAVQAEAYRRLRTNLGVLTLEREMRSVLVASAVPEEGKSLVAANLGFAFAQAGHRVVLVDADLRRSGLSNLLGIELAPGLSDVLSRETSGVKLRQPAGELPLRVLTSGSPPPNPSELLDSERFAQLLARLHEQAELVIVDAPAMLPVTDAAVIARLVSAVVLVVRTTTRVDQFDMAAEWLRTVGKQPIGAVLIGVRARSRAYEDGRPNLLQARRKMPV